MSSKNHMEYPALLERKELNLTPIKEELKCHLGNALAQSGIPKIQILY
jgi:hypothetical protein